jgi:hypothetical protein
VRSLSIPGRHAGGDLDPMRRLLIALGVVALLVALFMAVQFGIMLLSDGH